MNNDEERVHQAHNNMFVKAFSDKENVRLFLNMALPDELRENLDLSQLELDFTGYVSDRLKDAWADLVVKTTLKKPEPEKKLIDIYLLMEHKSYPDDLTLVQMLKYMYLQWQSDADQGKPLRVIIPIIFYHGDRKWNVPLEFVEKFNVPQSLKPFLLNFKYVFFDTKDKDFMSEANRAFKDHVFFLSALMLMKNAFSKDINVLSEIFELWHAKGFATERERVTTLLVYITEIRELGLEKVKSVLDEHHLDGGEIMLSLAEQLRNEGRLEGLQKGKKEMAKKVAWNMLNENYPLSAIIKFTGLTEQEIKALMS